MLYYFSILAATPLLRCITPATPLSFSPPLIIYFHSTLWLFRHWCHAAMPIYCHFRLIISLSLIYCHFAFLSSLLSPLFRHFFLMPLFIDWCWYCFAIRFTITPHYLIFSYAGCHYAIIFAIYFFIYLFIAAIIYAADAITIITPAATCRYYAAMRLYFHAFFDAAIGFEFLYISLLSLRQIIAADYFLFSLYLFSFIDAIDIDYAEHWLLLIIERFIIYYYWLRYTMLSCRHAAYADYCWCLLRHIICLMLD